MAGFETTAIALTYATYWLSQKLDIQAELREELRELQRSSTDAQGSNLPSFRHLEQLPLLHAVLMETLRLNAPIPGPQPRISLDGAMVGGYGKLAPGVRVSAQAYSLHRNPDIFPDPDEWQPLRWIAKDPQQEAHVKDRSRWFWAFSSGGRMCIGSNFAMLGEPGKKCLAASRD